jgi:hypothetical protein
LIADVGQIVEYGHCLVQLPCILAAIMRNFC